MMDYGLFDNLRLHYFMDNWLWRLYILRYLLGPWSNDLSLVDYHRSSWLHDCLLRSHRDASKWLGILRGSDLSGIDWLLESRDARLQIIGVGRGIDLRNRRRDDIGPKLAFLIGKIWSIRISHHKQFNFYWIYSNKQLLFNNLLAHESQI